MIPRTAKAYIALVIASGTTTLLFAAGSWSSASMKQFAIYLGLAALASTLKVRIPGLESTMSPNFVFVLLGMVVCSFAEVATISATAAVVQCLWASRKRPRLVQVAFSAAALVLSTGVAYELSHRLVTGSGVESSVSRVLVAGSLYLPINSALIAAVIGLVEGESLRRVFQRCYQSVFPYFVGGIGFASLVSGAYTQSTAWKGALVLLPVVVLAYIFSLNRTYAVTGVARPASAEEEEPVEMMS